MVGMADSSSEKHVRLPLKQRMKLMLANNQLADFLANVYANSNSSASADNDVPKADSDTEADSERLRTPLFSPEKMNADLSSEQSNGIKSSSVNEQDADKLKNNTCLTIKEENHTDMKAKEVRAVSSSPNLQEIKVKTEDQIDSFDKLDTVSLAERRKMLLARGTSRLANRLEKSKSVQMARQVLNKNSGGHNHYGEEGFRMSGVQLPVVKQTLNSDSPKHEIVIGLFCQGNEPVSWSTKYSKKKVAESPAITGHNILSRNRSVKLEPLNNNGTCPSKLLATKEVPEDSKVDIIDHMPLRDRLKMKLHEEVVPVDVSTITCSRNNVSPSPDWEFAPAVTKRGRSAQARKRRKTFTDSVETALEEDAPGLLQVLIENGVTVDEIKLYGETEDEEDLDDSSLEDSFSELEAVISKLFSQKTSLLKLEPLMKSGKGDKVSYCLACLFSLVEQARYLQFRKWPVEWGWCRDLQSFIFVFERHHRIVLERPEYGYATYFFELLETLPISWQIKRLVTSMRLTNCSRINLIENKSLVVGDGLSEGEAKVLMEYGWVPNTGLGTMLNYYDRVIHDRHEKDTSEWKSKIGKLLVDGYKGGTIVLDNIPKKAEEYNLSQSQPIKVELV